MTRRTPIGILVPLAAGLLVLLATAWLARVLLRPPATPAPPAALSIATLLAGDDAGHERALAPRELSFPADHGPHPTFRSEWWYVTGRLAAGRRRLGYQLTIFRQALAARTPARASAWASRQLYMGHLAISDVDGGRFLAFERLAREGLGLGGAQASPLRVWVEDWQMSGPPGGGLFPLRLRARAARAEIDLVLQPGRGPVLQGDRGFSVKGPEPGNASHYYSITRMPTRGRVIVDGAALEANGSSWLDREWSTSALGPELAGWDWLALHLSDGRDLMIYRLRRRDGGAAPESRATIVEPDGRTRLFGPDAFSLAASSWWTSPHTGARYPTRLAVRLPALDLDVVPLLEDQELRLSVRYWEGAVEARPRSPSSVVGAGYLEQTGYAP